MTDDLMGGRPWGLAALLAAAARRTDADLPEAAHLDLLVEGAITAHRLGGTGGHALSAKLAALREWAGRVFRRSGPNAALVDTTLVASIDAITLGDAPRRSLTSLTLLDLASFANAVILYEHVVVLPGAARAAARINAGLGAPVIVPLPITMKLGEYDQLLGVGALLGNLFESVLGELDLVRGASRLSPERADLNAMARSWSTLLGRKLAGTDVLAHRLDEWQDWDSDGPGLLTRLVAVEGPGGRRHSRRFEEAVRWPAVFDSFHSRRELTRFVSECNHRSYFNLRLSHLLGVPYVGSAARLPFRRQLYRHAAFAHHQLLLHREIDGYADRRAYHVTTRPTMTLPAFAAIALDRARDPAGVLTALGELREAATPLRQRRSAYAQALRDANHATAERLRAAIDADATTLGKELPGPVAAAASAALAAAASPTTGLTVALIGVCGLLAALPADRREAIARRLLRPAEWFLTSTADNARRIGALSERIASLWNLNDDDTAWIAARMRTLATLPPA